MEQKKHTPWTTSEASRFVILHSIGKYTLSQISTIMSEQGYPKRTEEALSDALRRNKLVRSLLYGDKLYIDRRPEVLQKSIERGEMGPVSIVQANRPRTDEEVAELFGIDTDIFYAHKILTNQWANNWQTKIDWRLNEGNAIAKAFAFEDLLKRMAGISWPVPQNITETGLPGTHVDMIEIVDAHHGGKSWAPETGTNWDIKISLGEHAKAHSFFLKNKHPFANTALVRLGDDIFAFDSLLNKAAGTTQKGTVQDIDTRWQKMFVEVVDLTISLLTITARLYDKVKVVLIQGNHDYQTSFYLGQLLYQRFKSDPRFEFDVTPRQRKYIRWGTSMVMMTHAPGKGGFPRLVNLLKEEARTDWAETDYAEIHVGDQHHEEVVPVSGSGVTNRILRALVPNDSWHDGEGYISVRGAQMFTFHKTEGLDRTVYYRTTKQAPSRPDANTGVTIRD